MIQEFLLWAFLATVTLIIGVWRRKPAWFMLSMLFSALTTFSANSPQQQTFCAVVNSTWSCHTVHTIVNYPSGWIAGLGLFFVSLGLLAVLIWPDIFEALRRR